MGGIREASNRSLIKRIASTARRAKLHPQPGRKRTLRPPVRPRRVWGPSLRSGEERDPRKREKTHSLPQSRRPFEVIDRVFACPKCARLFRKNPRGRFGQPLHSVHTQCFSPVAFRYSISYVSQKGNSGVFNTVDATGTHPKTPWVTPSPTTERKHIRIRARHPHRSQPRHGLPIAEGALMPPIRGARSERESRTTRPAASAHRAARRCPFS
jgi:hypothetical protein